MIDFLKGSNELAKKILEVLIQEYEIALKQYAKIATRQTIESLDGFSELNSNELTVKVTAAVSLLYIEFGRRAGAKMPPEGALDEWYSVKGIDPKLDFVIRRAIARRGIKPTPIGEFVLQNSRPKLEKIFFDYMTNEMRGQIETSIKTIYAKI